jgi:hypothetical protein
MARITAPAQRRSRTASRSCFHHTVTSPLGLEVTMGNTTNRASGWKGGFIKPGLLFRLFCQALSFSIDVEVERCILFRVVC